MKAVDLKIWRSNAVLESPVIAVKKPLIMGILNVTTDSFSDGGCYYALDDAYRQAERMISEGADIIDIGGESTRPGASSVSLDEELSRVIPIIEKIFANTGHCISIDTSKPEVMSAAVSAGAAMINDILALRAPGALKTAAELGVPVCLMHMLGKPETMQQHPDYPQGVVAGIQQFFVERLEACRLAGVSHEHIIIDPGFGFGKTVEHNLQLLKALDAFQELNLPVLIGVSRKSTIGALLSKQTDERLYGSLAMAAYAAMKGVSIIRVHDVDETNQVLSVTNAVLQA